MNDTHKDLVILKDFEARLNELMDLFPEGSLVPPPLRTRLQQLYAQLKADMRVVAKHDSALGSVVAEALSRMHPATNTHPIRSNWFDGLYAARFDLQHAIRSHQRQ